MPDALASLSAADFAALAAAARAGRLASPYTAAAVARLIAPAAAAPVAAELADLDLQPAQAATILDLLARTASRTGGAIPVELVATAPDAGAEARDTAVVVADLLRRAETSVLVAGYAVNHARGIFEVLAGRMAARPALDVRLFLDIRRGPGDTSLPAGIISRFLGKLRRSEWPPTAPLPPIYYDPRALAPDPDGRAALHAKCVVVDREVAFVSSANLTQAAQYRNIELGLLVASAPLARSIHAFFDNLIARGQLLRAE